MQNTNDKHKLYDECEERKPIHVIPMKNPEIHFSLRYVKDGQHLHMLGQKMEDLIFTVADTNFFFNDLEDCDQVIFSSHLFWWVADIMI